MKNLFYITFLTTLFILNSACDEKMEEMNTNPLALSELSDEYLFTNAVRQSFGECADILRFGSQYSHIYVTNSEHRAADNYLDFHTQDIYKFMYQEAYVNQLRIINEVLKITSHGEKVNPVRHAIATTVAILNFAQVTDQWGDIPYFNGARGGDGILFPVYDRQEDIYYDMLDRLENAITILKSASPADAYPGADPIYDNDLTKWLRFANSLRFRLAMRIRFAVPSVSTQIITECMSEPFIELNEHNFELKHQVSDNRDLYNPWFDLRNVLNWKMSQKLTDWLVASSDPRLGILIEKNSAGEYKGVPNGLNDQAVSQINWPSYSNPGPRLYAKDMSEYLMCASEIWFLRSEAALFGLAPGDANALYRQGIIADMARWNIPAGDINTWLSTNPQANLTGTNEQKFEQIGNQAWIAFIPNFNEAWNAIKRTGYPVIPKRTNSDIFSLGVTDGYLPKRFKYSSAEYLNNNANVTEAVNKQGPDLIDTPVWWDVKGN